jgi:hypothetical protein
LNADAVFIGLGVHRFSLQKARAVTLGLRATDPAQLCRRGAFAREYIVAVRGRRIPARPAVEDEDITPGAGKNKGSGQTSRTGADDQHVGRHGEPLEYGC